MKLAHECKTENTNLAEIQASKKPKIFGIYITTREEGFNKKWEDSNHDMQEMYFLRIQMLEENKD